MKLIGGTATFALLSSALAAEELEPSDKKQEASVAGVKIPNIVKEHPYWSTAAAGVAAFPKKALKAADKIIAPFLTPAISIAAHGKPDVTSGLEWITPAFWNAMTKRFGLTGTLEAFKKAPNAAAKSKIAIEMLLRAGIPHESYFRLFQGELQQSLDLF